MKYATVVKVRGHLYILPLTGKPESSGSQCEVEYWPALAVGSAAQLAAAHCPN